MSVSKKAVKNSGCKLKGSLKKCGFDRWRYFFNGINSASGEERLFYIELMAQNPALSYERTVLPQTEEAPKLDAADLQAALAGNIETKPAQGQKVIPSYACVRAGVFGSRPKQLNRFFPNSEFVAAKRGFDVKAGGCAFSDNQLHGVLAITEVEARSFTEWKSAAGLMEWNLKYERDFDAPEVFTKDSKHWLAGGLTARFSGMVTLDGQEYAVSPDHSFGYVDKSWGTALPIPFMHISSSRLTSIFTGKVMKDSGFALEGDYDGKLAALAKFEGEYFGFGPGQNTKKYAAASAGSTRTRFIKSKAKTKTEALRRCALSTEDLSERGTSTTFRRYSCAYSFSTTATAMKASTFMDSVRAKASIPLPTATNT